MKNQSEKLNKLTQNENYQEQVREIAKLEAVNIIQLSKAAQPVIDAGVEVFFTMLSKITNSTLRGTISLGEDFVVGLVAAVPGLGSVMEIVMSLMSVFGMIMGVVAPAFSQTIKMGQTVKKGIDDIKQVRDSQQEQLELKLLFLVRLP